MYLKELLPETEPKVDTIGERLLKAAQIIRERGWWAPSVGDLSATSGYCAVMAISRAGGGLDTFNAAVDRLASHLGLSQRDGVVHWSDRSGGSAVIEALEKAARS